MKFNSTNDVRKWLRNIPFLKKELELKIKFYKELQSEFGSSTSFSKSVKYYESEIEALNKKITAIINDMDKLFNVLDENERMIMTARYINLIRWDYIEMHTFYCRRQAIRIHNRALGKLVGQTVDGDI